LLEWGTISNSVEWTWVPCKDCSIVNSYTYNKTILECVKIFGVYFLKYFLYKNI